MSPTSADDEDLIDAFIDARRAPRASQPIGWVTGGGRKLQALRLSLVAIVLLGGFGGPAGLEAAVVISLAGSVVALFAAFCGGNYGEHAAQARRPVSE